MKNTIRNKCHHWIRPIVVCCTLGLMCLDIAAQSPVGIWKQISSTKDTVTSHIKIYKEDGKLYGKVLQLTPAAEVRVCDQCEGDRKGEPIEGMQIMWDMEPQEDHWANGQILAPKTGKVYHCIIRMKDEDTLEVRGHLGIPALGRSQEWIRMEQ